MVVVVRAVREERQEGGHGDGRLAAPTYVFCWLVCLLFVLIAWLQLFVLVLLVWWRWSPGRPDLRVLLPMIKVIVIVSIKLFVLLVLLLVLWRWSPGRADLRVLLIRCMHSFGMLVLTMFILLHVSLSGCCWSFVWHIWFYKPRRKRFGLSFVSMFVVWNIAVDHDRFVVMLYVTYGFV